MSTYMTLEEYTSTLKVGDEVTEVNKIWKL